MAGGMPDLRIERPTESVPEMVVRRIRQAILDGVLTPGRRLTERELIELTGVSRTSIREAVRNLQSLGLVETSQSRGVRVAVLGSADVQQIYEVRGALEPTAAALFVQRAADGEVAELATLVGHERSEEDQLVAIRRFDELLLAGARNPLLTTMLAPLHARINALRRLSLSIPGRMQSSDREYVAIVGAIKERSVDRAVKLSRQHVDAAMTAALEAVRKLEELRTHT